MHDANGMFEVDEFEDLTLVDRFFHIPRTLNITTRVRVKLEDPGSVVKVCVQIMKGLAWKFRSEGKEYVLSFAVNIKIFSAFL